MIIKLLIAIISGIGLGISLFFGIYLLRLKKVQNTILGVLLIVLTLRITKSVFYNYIELPVFIKNLGLAANLAVGPLLYIYGRSLFIKTKTQLKFVLFHFIPSSIYLIFCNSIPNEINSVFWKLSYSFILVHSFSYVIASLFISQKRQITIDKKVREWYILLVLALCLVWIVYTLIFIKLIPVYSAGIVAFSILMFIILFLAFDRKGIFDNTYKEKYLNSNITIEDGEVHLNRIRKLIEEENLYLDPNLKLASLSSRLNLSSRDISMIVNKHANKNFSSFINEYRIKKAKEFLSTSHPDTKILAIALDSGFNSLSSFNVAFKSFTKSTPSEYRLKNITRIVS
ncbi:AraC family transcriptional regulator [Aquimarina megaterium]|uniref:AraC family transcriptional regulator n=1 Tax=Aquimarina megaterium TaxID=1443666 RepID=UPI000470A7FE|nr:helix-turn-helix domain-containing protein [Aquimarina megaterium]